MATYDSKAIRRRAGALWVVLAVALVGLAALVGGGAGTASATGCVFTLSSPTYSVAEGAIVQISVNRSGGTCTNNIGVSITNGTASSPGSYLNNTPASLPFTAGDATKSLPVQTVEDAIVGNLTFNVTISFNSGANGDTLGTTSAVVTILDNDGPPVFSFSQSNYTVNENGGIASITVNRSGLVNTTAVSVSYSTSDGSAVSPGDYTSIGTTPLSFAIGQTQATFSVFITNDGTQESTEAFSVHLSSPSNGGSVGADASVTIIDDDGPGTLQFGLPNYSVVEQTGTTSLNVTRVGGINGAVSVACSTGGGSATAGLDYTTVTNQILSWASGDGADKQCVIPILDDLTQENAETVGVSLSSPTGGAALGAQSVATLTITDNDGTGLIEFATTTYTVAETGVSALVTLTRSGGTTGMVSVDCTTLAGGTATANVDYTAGSFTATFGAGVTTATCAIPIIDDTLVEGLETVFLGLTNPTGGAGVGSPSTATLTISDSETGGPSITSLTPAFGPTAGGTLVAIAGVNLSGAMSVTFGGFPAVYGINSDVSISATAPAHGPGAVNVIITTPNGVSVATVNSTYTYTDGPTVTFVDPNTGPASGAPAVFVTITGTNFLVGSGTGMTVKFGTTGTTDFTVTSTTSITVVAPPHVAGTVDIVVSTPVGSSPVSVADQFTFVGSTAPVVTGVSPASGPAGTIVTIAGSGFTGVTCPGGITFGGVSAASDGTCIVNNDSSITAKVPAGAPSGTIDVRVTGPGGQSANTAADDFNNTSSAGTYTYTLNFRFTLIGWAGPNNTPVLAALQGTVNAQVTAAASQNSIYNVVTAIWTYDTASQSYKGYFPGSENIPGANDFTVFKSGVGYFIAISVSTVQWTVIQG